MLELVRQARADGGKMRSFTQRGVQKKVVCGVKLIVKRGNAVVPNLRPASQGRLGSNSGWAILTSQLPKTYGIEMRLIQQRGRSFLQKP